MSDTTDSDQTEKPVFGSHAMDEAALEEFDFQLLLNVYARVAPTVAMTTEACGMLAVTRVTAVNALSGAYEGQALREMLSRQIDHHVDDLTALAELENILLRNEQLRLSNRAARAAAGEPASIDD